MASLNRNLDRLPPHLRYAPERLSAERAIEALKAAELACEIDFEVDHEIKSRRISRLDDIALRIRQLPYSEMIKLAAGLWQAHLEIDGCQRSAVSLPAIWHRWATQFTCTGTTQQLDGAYVKQAKADVALQLSRAGVRLAHLLNHALK